MGQDRDPIINREQRRTVLSENPEPPLKMEAGGAPIHICLLSYSSLSAAVGGGNTAAQPVCPAKDDRPGQIAHISDTKPVPGQ